MEVPPLASLPSLNLVDFSLESRMWNVACQLVQLTLLLRIETHLAWSYPELPFPSPSLCPVLILQIPPKSVRSPTPTLAHKSQQKIRFQKFRIRIFDGGRLAETFSLGPAQAALRCAPLPTWCISPIHPILIRD